jgi:hypothetical protein
MTNFDLLDTVLSPEGWYAVVGIKGKRVKQQLVQTRTEVDNLVAEWISEKYNLYFGCAKFETGDNRLSSNAAYFKALWIDLDCGEDKAEKGEGYADQAEGLQALQKFCRTIGLPKPILVNSGRGIHAYWAFTEPIDKESWLPLNDRLAELCRIHDLKADPKCFEAARVLRIPGTFNFKDNPPGEVKVLSSAPLCDSKELRTTMGVKEKKFAPPRNKERSALTLSLMANRVSSFKKIMMRSAKGDGCQQLVYCFQNQETIDYNLWRSALSIAAFCKEGVNAAHKMSVNHPGYDPEEVDNKVRDLQRNGGPHFCETFEKSNPGGCDGCVHKGKITTPIVLGKEIAEAEPDAEGNYVIAEEEASSESEPVQYTVPAYPSPFYRGKYGGVYRRAMANEDDDTLIYEHDLYVTKMMKDPSLDNAMSALLRLHLPCEGVEEFAVPLESIVVKEDLRKVLSRRGVMGYQKQMENIATFVQASVKDLQLSRKAEIMRPQFGWADDDSKFIVGDREITADGVFYSPPSNLTKTIAEWMKPTGTLEKWQEVFNLYNKPGLEPHAFAALTAFGAPLLKFTGLNGAVINVIFRKSGSGKSTTLYMCNSVWGHPERLVAIPRDTMNARIHRLGVMNNLPFTMDEITNMTAEEFSDLLYGMSQGRGKDRQKASANELRANLTFWQNLSLASANASFEEKLGALKNTPDGELMRFLEYEIGYNNVIPTDVGKKMFDHQLRENYGHAGDIYAFRLVSDKEDVVRTLMSVQDKIDRELKLSPRERFWSAIVACNITGGLVANDLGLIDFDMGRIYKWACNLIRELRENKDVPVDSASNIVGDYINRHVRNTLVVNGEADARTKLSAAPQQEPYGELLIRYEPDTKQMFIVSRAFREDCVKTQINYKDLLKQLSAKGIYKGATTRRMTTGTKIKGTPVHVLHFDCNTPDFITVDDYFESEAKDASGGSDVPD